MVDSSQWAAEIEREWHVITGAPYLFAAVLLVALGFMWLGFKAWNGRGDRIVKARIELLTAERDGETRRKEALKERLLALQPEAPVLAIEIAGDPDTRSVVETLASGKTIETPIDPAQGIVVPVVLTLPQARQIAALIFTQHSGLSTATSTTNAFVNTATASAAITALQLIQLRPPDKSEKL